MFKKLLRVGASGTRSSGLGWSRLTVARTCRRRVGWCGRCHRRHRRFAVIAHALWWNRRRLRLRPRRVRSLLLDALLRCALHLLFLLACGITVQAQRRALHLVGSLFFRCQRNRRGGRTLLRLVGFLRCLALLLRGLPRRVPGLLLLRRLGKRIP